MSGKGRIICVFTPKGGVGKTTVAVNLSLNLAGPCSDVKDAYSLPAPDLWDIVKRNKRSDTKVALIDADGSRNSFTLLGPIADGDTRADRPETLAEYFQGTIGADQLFVLSPYCEVPEDNLAPVLVSNGDPRLLHSHWLQERQHDLQNTKERMAGLLDFCRQNFAYTIVDFPYMSDPADLNRLFLVGTDHVLMVLSSFGDFDTQAYDLGTRDLRQILGERAQQALLGVVVNRFPPKLAAGADELEDADHAGLKEMKRDLRKRKQFLLCLPESDAQRRAMEVNVPVFVEPRHNPINRKFMQLARLVKEKS